MNLKEKVLAKCRGIIDGMAPNDNSPHVGGYVVTWESWNDELIIELEKTQNGSIKYSFSEHTDENDEVWPLAASVLGVGVEKSPHRKATEQLVMTPKTDGFSLTIDVRGKESPFSHHHAIGSIRELTGMALEMGQYVPIKGISIAKEVIDAFAEYWNSEGSVPITRLHNAVKALGLCGLVPNESPKPDWVKEEIKEMRSKSQLEQAYWAGARDQQRWNFLNQVPEYGTSRFLDWMETVPKDDMNDDMKALRNCFVAGDIESELRALGYNPEFIKKLKRLCGLEVNP